MAYFRKPGSTILVDEQGNQVPDQKAALATYNNNLDAITEYSGAPSTTQAPTPSAPSAPAQPSTPQPTNTKTSDEFLSTFGFTPDIQGWVQVLVARSDGGITEVNKTTGETRVRYPSASDGQVERKNLATQGSQSKGTPAPLASLGGSSATQSLQTPQQAPVADATLGTTPMQVGGKFGTQNFGRIGTDVVEIMSDGSQRKVSEAEFMQKLKPRGLNLEVLPQVSEIGGFDMGFSTGTAGSGPDGIMGTADDTGAPKAPSNFISDYQNILKELGISSIKSQFDDFQKQFKDLQDKKLDEQLEINDNPWLSEGVRVAKLRKLDEKYAGRESNLTNQMKLVDSIYQEGLAQAKFLTSGLQEDRNKLLDLAMKREEAQMKMAQQEFENALDLEKLTIDQKKLALDQWKATGGGDGISTGSINGGKYTGIINTILGSGKFTKDQVNLVRNAINNGQDPISVIKNQAKNILGQTEANTLGKFEVSKQSLLDIQDALNAFYAAGGSTGIFSGNMEKTINKLGNVKDPKLVSLATQIAANLQIYRNAVSGTAYSVQEGADIAAIFPGINKTQGLNQAIIDGRLAAFDSTIDATYRNVLGSAYDSLKVATTNTGTPPQAPTAPSFSARSVIPNAAGDYAAYLKSIGR